MKEVRVRFSVIIPLYNKEAYIEQTLGSVLAQTYPFFEVIIVDDGSSDASLQIVNGITDSRIRVISQVNSGVATARNRGVKEAKENYVAFMDADDFWAPNYLERIAFLISTCPDAGIFACRYVEMMNGNRKAVSIDLETTFEYGYISYFSLYAKTFISPVWTSATIVLRDIFLKNGGFNTSLKMGEDIDLWVRIALKEPISYLNEELAYYNNDQIIENRLSKKLYAPEESYIFSLDTLKKGVSNDCLFLLDGLILRTLRPYYALGFYRKETDRILKSVNFQNHPLVYRVYYHLPRWMAKGIYLLLKKMRAVLS